MNDILVNRQANLPQQLTVLVTGAASGIGYAQMMAFLNNGHRVLAVDIQVIPATHEQLVCVQADVSNMDGVQKVWECLAHHFGELHVLCNTAGVLDDYKTAVAISFDEWQRILAVNLNSQFLMCQMFLPYLLAQPASRIINMASIAGLTAGGGGVAYTAAKHAIVGLTRQLAYDYAATGLRVNAIAPGAIQTAMTQADFAGDKTMAKWVAEQTPVKRWAQPEEVADLTLFLASDAADYMQGVILPLDGGWLIR